MELLDIYNLIILVTAILGSAALYGVLTVLDRWMERRENRGTD